MDSLKLAWKTWSMRIDAMSFRERILVFVAVAGVAMSLMFVGLIEPALKRQEQMLMNSAALQEEIFTLRGQLASLDPANQSGANTELGRLRAQAKLIEQQVKARESGLIGPEKMIAALKTLMSDQSGLTLVSLENVPGKPAVTTSDTDATTDTPAPPPLPVELYYTHGVTLRLQGSYAELTRYVERLEALPWTLQWESVRLDANAHPRIELTLKLNTLSREATWARL
ncbi:type II secretion system protein GspM [Thiobacillus sp.]|uniref:type II secretion system protein GspM n=1 Tax=Thiobacillus sp. TaxID=924 RepID=UPI0025E9E6EB|nr:type II secretion system protein GspM [Thiobacillus sp.]MBT9540406.1 type II secretion system protein M [Thiobacillus sp.]